MKSPSRFRQDFLKISGMVVLVVPGTVYGPAPASGGGVYTGYEPCGQGTATRAAVRPGRRVAMIYAFEAYTLDTDRYELRRAGILCPLEPHALEILAYLLTHRDRVVTKQELLEHLWPQRWVSEGTLTQRLMMIRKALGDSGRRQHCIKTIHGRGYRFVATVVVHTPLSHHGDLAAPAAPGDPTRHGEASPAGVVVPEKATPLARSQTRMDRDRSGTRAIPRHPPPPLFRRPPHFVGREAELAQLSQWWTTVQQGRRQVGLIGGEPGIGKTALVDTFVAHVAAAEELWVGRGQCVDHYGTGSLTCRCWKPWDAWARMPRGSSSCRVSATMLPVGSRTCPRWSRQPSARRSCAQPIA